MHSFLSKVFGRNTKKDDKEKEKETSPTTLAPGELLGGKFEAVSPTVSPSAAKFLDLEQHNQKHINGHDKEKEKEQKDKESGPSSFLSRVKSRPASPEVKPTKKVDTLPHLSLDFGGKEEAVSPSNDNNDLEAFLDVDPDTQGLLSDAVIGQRRLNPMEALVLIRACSQAIVSRGLETLGIMHPHWYSASPDVQRRLISQFIRSLTPVSNPTNSLALTPGLLSPFESEIESVRDPHDVASVLRWGLRHLQLNSEYLGGTDEGWYKAFLDAEAAAEYPPKAFSEKLAPALPQEHLDLLVATLEIFSSLAAHSEANSTSGSKLSKIFGLWLLTARRVETKDDWRSFYTRWERTGRMLEHLFLARIRDESTDQRMPLRLLELVRKYPYTQGLSSPHTDLHLLPPSRFTTQRHGALYVRVEIQIEDEEERLSSPSKIVKGKGKESKSKSRAEKEKERKKVHPIQLIADALSVKLEGAEGDEGHEEFAQLWKTITDASKEGSLRDASPISALNNVFSDETIRLLSMIPSEQPTKPKSPVFELVPSPPSSPHRRAFSTDESTSTSKPTAAVQPTHTKPATEPNSNSSPPQSPTSPISVGDWAQFSASGFLDTTPGIGPLVSTLFDQDLEKTVPPEPQRQGTFSTLSASVSRKSSRKANARKSVDVADKDRPNEKDKAKEWEELMDKPEEYTEKLKETEDQTADKPKSGANIRLSNFQIIELDEAFVDFWSDALLDPIARDWPSFVVCKFKSDLVSKLVFAPLPPTSSTGENGTGGHAPKLLKWLVLEQVYTTPPPPPPPPNTAISPSTSSAGPTSPLGPSNHTPRPVSPSTQSTSGKKRFSFWSSISRSTSESSVSSQKDKEKEKGGAGGKKAARIGEMGELIEEESGEHAAPAHEHHGKTGFGSIIKLKTPSFKSRRSSDAKHPASAPTPIPAEPATKPSEKEKEREGLKPSTTTTTSGEADKQDDAKKAGEAAIATAALGTAALATGAALTAVPEEDKVLPPTTEGEGETEGQNEKEEEKPAEKESKEAEIEAVVDDVAVPQTQEVEETVGEETVEAAPAPEVIEPAEAAPVPAPEAVEPAEELQATPTETDTVAVAEAPTSTVTVEEPDVQEPTAEAEVPTTVTAEPVVHSEEPGKVEVADVPELEGRYIVEPEIVAETLLLAPAAEPEGPVTTAIKEITQPEEPPVVENPAVAEAHDLFEGAPLAGAAAVGIAAAAEVKHREEEEQPTLTSTAFEAETEPEAPAPAVQDQEVAAVEVEEDEPSSDPVAEVVAEPALKEEEDEEAVTAPVVEVPVIQEEEIEPAAPVPSEPITVDEEAEVEGLAAAPPETGLTPDPVVSEAVTDEVEPVADPAAGAERDVESEEKTLEEAAVAPAEAELTSAPLVEEASGGEERETEPVSDAVAVVVEAPASEEAEDVEEVTVEPEVEPSSTPLVHEVATEDEKVEPISDSVPVAVDEPATQEDRATEEDAVVPAEVEQGSAPVAGDSLVVEEDIEPPVPVSAEETTPEDKEAEVLSTIPSETELAHAPVFDEAIPEQEHVDPVVEPGLTDVIPPTAQEEDKPAEEVAGPPAEIESTTHVAQEDVVDEEVQPAVPTSTEDLAKDPKQVPVVPNAVSAPTTAVHEAVIDKADAEAATNEHAVEEEERVVEESADIPIAQEAVVEEKVEATPEPISVVIGESTGVDEEKDVGIVDAASAERTSTPAGPEGIDEPALPAAEEELVKELQMEDVTVPPSSVVEGAIAEGGDVEPAPITASEEEVVSEVIVPTAEVELTPAPTVNDTAVEEEHVESTTTPFAVALGESAEGLAKDHADEIEESSVPTSERLPADVDERAADEVGKTEDVAAPPADAETAPNPIADEAIADEEKVEPAPESSVVAVQGPVTEEEEKAVEGFPDVADPTSASLAGGTAIQEEEVVPAIESVPASVEEPNAEEEEGIAEEVAAVTEVEPIASSVVRQAVEEEEKATEPELAAPAVDQVTIEEDGEEKDKEESTLQTIEPEADEASVLAPAKVEVSQQPPATVVVQDEKQESFATAEVESEIATLVPAVQDQEAAPLEEEKFKTTSAAVALTSEEQGIEEEAETVDESAAVVAPVETELKPPVTEEAMAEPPVTEEEIAEEDGANSAVPVISEEKTKEAVLSEEVATAPDVQVEAGQEESDEAVLDPVPSGLEDVVREDGMKGEEEVVAAPAEADPVPLPDVQGGEIGAETSEPTEPIVSEGAVVEEIEEVVMTAGTDGGAAEPAPVPATEENTMAGIAPSPADHTQAAPTTASEIQQAAVEGGEIEPAAVSATPQEPVAQEEEIKEAETVQEPVLVDEEQAVAENAPVPPESEPSAAQVVETSASEEEEKAAEAVHIVEEPLVEERTTENTITDPQEGTQDPSEAVEEVAEEPTESAVAVEQSPVKDELEELSAVPRPVEDAPDAIEEADTQEEAPIVAVAVPDSKEGETNEPTADADETSVTEDKAPEEIPDASETSAAPPLPDEATVEGKILEGEGVAAPGESGLVSEPVAEESAAEIPIELTPRGEGQVAEEGVVADAAVPAVEDEPTATEEERTVAELEDVSLPEPTPEQTPRVDDVVVEEPPSEEITAVEQPSAPAEIVPEAVMMEQVPAVEENEVIHEEKHSPTAEPTPEPALAVTDEETAVEPADKAEVISTPAIVDVSTEATVDEKSEHAQVHIDDKAVPVADAEEPEDIAVVAEVDSAPAPVVDNSITDEESTAETTSTSVSFEDKATEDPLAAATTPHVAETGEESLAEEERATTPTQQFEVNPEEKEDAKEQTPVAAELVAEAPLAEGQITENSVADVASPREAAKEESDPEVAPPSETAHALSAEEEVRAPREEENLPVVEEAVGEAVQEELSPDVEPHQDVQAEQPAAELLADNEAVHSAHTGNLTPSFSSEAVIIASSTPSTEPITLPPESAADDLVDLPPVPLVDASPAKVEDNVHITVPLEEPDSDETVPAEADLAAEEPSVKAIPEGSDIPDSVVRSGSTPGPQLALSSAENHTLEPPGSLGEVDAAPVTDDVGVPELSIVPDVTATAAEVDGGGPVDVPSKAEPADIEAVNGNGQHATSDVDAAAVEPSASEKSTQAEIGEEEDKTILDTEEIPAVVNGHESKADASVVSLPQALDTHEPAVVEAEEADEA